MASSWWDRRWWYPRRMGATPSPGSATGIRPSSAGNPDLVSGPGELRRAVDDHARRHHVARRRSAAPPARPGAGSTRARAAAVARTPSPRRAHLPGLHLPRSPPMRRPCCWWPPRSSGRTSGIWCRTRAPSGSWWRPASTVHLLEWLAPGALGRRPRAGGLCRSPARAGRGGGHPGRQPGPRCSRGTPSVARWPRSSAALHPDRVRGVVLLEAPLHFGADAGAFAPLVAASPDLRRVQPLPGLVPARCWTSPRSRRPHGSSCSSATSTSSPPSGSRCPRCTCASSGGPWTRWPCPPGCSPRSSRTSTATTGSCGESSPIAGRRLGPESMTVPMLHRPRPAQHGHPTQLHRALPPSCGQHAEAAARIPRRSRCGTAARRRARRPTRPRLALASNRQLACTPCRGPFSPGRCGRARLTPAGLAVDDERVSSPVTNITHAECRQRAAAITVDDHRIELDLRRAADPDATTFRSRTLVAFTARTDTPGST